MDATTIMHADYLDIIFDNRNKSYGGYELRKNYNRRVGKAFAFLALGICTLVSMSFINIRRADKIANSMAVVKPTIVTINAIKPEPKVIKESTPPPAAMHVKTRTLTPPVIDRTDDVPDDKLMTQNKEMASAHPGPANMDNDTADIAPMYAKGGNGTGAVTQPKSNVPVAWVEQMPQFEGDMTAYISTHLIYPAAAREAHIDGRVVIRFVVNEDGTVSNATVERGIGGDCDQEALRMVSGMPKWKPGKQNGMPVKVYFTLPVIFLLQ